MGKDQRTDQHERFHSWYLLQAAWSNRTSRWKPSVDNWMKPHDHRSWYSWGTLTTAVSAGKASELGSSSSGDFWRGQHIVSSHKWSVSQWGKLLCWICHWWTRKNSSGSWRLMAAVSRSWWSLKYWEVCKTNSRVTTLDLRTGDCGLLRVLLVRNPWDMVYKGKGTWGQMVDLQGHLLQNRKRVHSSVQKVEQAW